MAIKYLRRHEIDMNRWDQCLRESGNGCIYAYSFYMDAMASNWDALVLDDYAAVMPLPWRKKWGIRYIYQPFLTAQLGVFGKGVTQSIVEKFLNAIPSRFKLWEFPLNAGNLFSEPPSQIYVRKNYILPLNSSVEALILHYKEQTKRNIKKAGQNDLVVQRNISIDDVIDLVKAHGFINPKDLPFLHRFKEMCEALPNPYSAKTYGVYSKENVLIASAAFILSYNRAYYLLAGNTPAGKSTGASHLLIHTFISDHAGTSLTLDFEGSDIESIAFFYSSFGATPELYPAVQANHLPFYLKWLKKS